MLPEDVTEDMCENIDKERSFLLMDELSGNCGASPLPDVELYCEPMGRGG